MAESVTASRRLLVEDARHDGRHLRTTWHRDERQFVISTWDPNLVCTGTVRVDLADAGRLIGHLAVGLADAASHETEEVVGRRSRSREAVAFIRRMIFRLGGPPHPPNVVPLPRVVTACDDRPTRGQ